MKGILLGQILISIIIVGLLIKVLKVSKAFRYSERLNKYTVNKKEEEKLSLGDKILDKYSKLKKVIIKMLSSSMYFKKKAIRYERFGYLNNSPLGIIATKICFSLIAGAIYLISSVYKSNFDFFFLLLLMTIGYFIYDLYLIASEKIRNKMIEEDLLKAIIIMNNAFKSGYTITQAIEIVSKDLTGPISDEFKKIGNDLKYGLELKDVFERFYNRVRIDDAKYITSSLSLLNLTGGNLVGIFTSIEKSFTNRKRLRDELNAMTSSSKLVFYILLVMPILIISLLLILSPEYYEPLFTSALGYLICLIAILLYLSYILIIRKILKVD
jgi:tight adherence protein B